MVRNDLAECAPPIRDTASSPASPVRKERSLVAHTLVSPDFFSGWGIRTVGCHEARYNPLSYHNGSVWPHDNAMIAAGMARYDHREFAGRILMNLLDLSGAVELHRLPELFCGVDRREGQGPTLYPVACSPQSWAAGAVFMLLAGLPRHQVDAKHRRVIFDRPLFAARHPAALDPRSPHRRLPRQPFHGTRLRSSPNPGS